MTHFNFSYFNYSGSGGGSAPVSAPGTSAPPLPPRIPGSDALATSGMAGYANRSLGYGSSPYGTGYGGSYGSYGGGYSSGYGSYGSGYGTGYGGYGSYGGMGYGRTGFGGNTENR